MGIGATPSGSKVNSTGSACSGVKPLAVMVALMLPETSPVPVPAVPVQTAWPASLTEPQLRPAMVTVLPVGTLEQVTVTAVPAGALLGLAMQTELSGFCVKLPVTDLLDWIFVRLQVVPVQSPLKPVKV